MWEAMTVAGWVLGRTSTLQVGHLVLCDPLRHPAVLARQVASLDHASGGRFELGIGWGSVPEELETFGVGTTEARWRVARLAEWLDVCGRPWTGVVVDHAAIERAQSRDRVGKDASVSGLDVSIKTIKQ